MNRRALLLVALGAAILSPPTRAELADRLTDQVRLSLSGPEWATVSYEYHFHHGGPLYREPFFQVGMGLGGGKVSVGAGFLDSPPPGDYCEGQALKLSLLRTWGHPAYGDEHATFVGVEAEHFFAVLGDSVVSVGIFHQLTAESHDQEILVTAGIGIPIFSSPRGPSFFGH